MYIIVYDTNKNTNNDVFILSDYLKYPELQVNNEENNGVSKGTVNPGFELEPSEKGLKTGPVKAIQGYKTKLTAGKH